MEQHCRALELTKMMLVNVNIDEHEPKSKSLWIALQKST